MAGIFGAMTFGGLMFMRLLMDVLCLVIVVGMSVGFLHSYLLGMMDTRWCSLCGRDEASEKNCGKSSN